MIERSFSDRDTHSRALFSECGAYRYALTRRWGRGRRLTLVLLNPSLKRLGGHNVVVVVSVGNGDFLCIGTIGGTVFYRVNGHLVC